MKLALDRFAFNLAEHNKSTLCALVGRKKCGPPMQFRFDATFGDVYSPALQLCAIARAEAELWDGSPTVAYHLQRGGP